MSKVTLDTSGSITYTGTPGTPLTYSTTGTGTGTYIMPYEYYDNNPIYVNSPISMNDWNSIKIGSVEMSVEEWDKVLAKILDWKPKEKVKARPQDPIDRVFFNYKKRTTTILWKDKTVTTVTCAEDEEFDEEKGIAMCFMKKFFGNRGCFNEFLKKYLEEGIVQ